MKKVLLVRPPFSHPELKPYPPFSLVTLAPYFKDAEITIHDMQNSTIEPNYKSYDALALSGFTSQLLTMDQIAEKAKAANPNIKIAAGGSGVTSDPQLAQSTLKNVDLLVAGDGEEFALNWQTYINYNGVFHTKRFDWENQRTPDWSLINYERYLNFPGLPVESSRGCCFNCVFCTAHCVNGKVWRPRNPKDVVWEIKYLKDRYGCKLFYFPDDNATVNPERWITLMQEIINAQLNIRLHAPEGIQAHHLDHDTLSLMKKAGFRNIYIGAESGSQRVLDKVIDKGGLTIEKIESVVRDSVSLGLTVNCFFVIGIVGETLTEAKATVDFAEKMRSLGAYDCTVRNAIPIQGTRMYQIAKEKGYIINESNTLNTHQTRHLLATPEWTPQQIETLIYIAQKQQAQHLLKHKKIHMLKTGIPRLFSNPRIVFHRLNQIQHEATKNQ